MMKKQGGNDPYANQQAPRKNGRAPIQQETSFDNNSSYDSEDNSMDASAFVNKHCNFAEASMMASELGHSQMNQAMPPGTNQVQQSQPNPQPLIGQDHA